jgi:hypothetical protein
MAGNEVAATPKIATRAIMARVLNIFANLIDLSPFLHGGLLL